MKTRFNPFPKVSGKYGAPIGRCGTNPANLQDIPLGMEPIGYKQIKALEHAENIKDTACDALGVFLLGLGVYGYIKIMIWAITV